MRREDGYHKMNPNDDCDNKHDDSGVRILMQTEMVLHLSPPFGSKQAHQDPPNFHPDELVDRMRKLKSNAAQNDDK